METDTKINAQTNPMTCKRRIRKGTNGSTGPSAPAKKQARNHGKLTNERGKLKEPHHGEEAKRHLGETVPAEHEPNQLKTQPNKI